ncbi:MAG: HEAT repeat domain-containing protein [Candidatus Omnitrophica bacterium]|nr:HEAT repeat domain-containing protein [Candidatus Omnitrophota bacterium]
MATTEFGIDGENAKLEKIKNMCKNKFEKDYNPTNKLINLLCRNERHIFTYSFLKGIDPSVCEAPVKALGEIKNSETVEPLISALKDGKEWDGREAVAYALGEIKDIRAIESLIYALKDNNLRVRKRVAKVF